MYLCTCYLELKFGKNQKLEMRNDENLRLGGDNRFNQKAAVWHGLMWLGIICLVCLCWAMLLTGCSSKKSVVQQQVVSVAKDSSAVKQTEKSMARASRDSTLIIGSEKNHWSLAFDSTFLSQVIERTIIIRQDENGKEISRETNTTITNNRERNRGLLQGSKDTATSRTAVKDSTLVSLNTSNDSVGTHWAKTETNETTEVKQELNWWQKLQLFFKIVVQVLAWLLEIAAVAYIVYIIYRVIKKIYGNVQEGK